MNWSCFKVQMKLKLVCDEDNHMVLTSETDLPKVYQWKLQVESWMQIISWNRQLLVNN